LCKVILKNINADFEEYKLSKNSKPLTIETTKKNDKKDKKASDTNLKTDFMKKNKKQFEEYHTTNEDNENYITSILIT